MKKGLFSLLMLILICLAFIPVDAKAYEGSEYGVWVGGIAVNEANKDCVVSDGSIKFTPATESSPAILTLDGAHITDGEDFEGYYMNGIYSDYDLIIDVISDSSIVSTTSNWYGIYGASDIVITGDDTNLDIRLGTEEESPINLFGIYVDKGKLLLDNSICVTVNLNGVLLTDGIGFGAAVAGYNCENLDYSIYLGAATNEQEWLAFQYIEEERIDLYDLVTSGKSKWIDPVDLCADVKLYGVDVEAKHVYMVNKTILKGVSLDIKEMVSADNDNLRSAVRQSAVMKVYDSDESEVTTPIDELESGTYTVCLENKMYIRDAVVTNDTTKNLIVAWPEGVKPVATLTILDVVANNSTYNGLNQELITSPETDDTAQYAIGADSTTVPTEGWSTTIPLGTDAGTYFIWFRSITSENEILIAPFCTEVTIAQKDITGATVGSFDLTYSGNVQTPDATVTIDGLAATGTWSDVTVLSDKTTFTASGNFTGVIADVETDMAKLAPTEAPSEMLTTVKPSTYGDSNGKIVGTSTDMEYSKTTDFADAIVCSEGETVGLPAGTYYVRIRATENTEVGPYATVIIRDGYKYIPPEPTPDPEPEDEPKKTDTIDYTIPVKGEDVVQIEAAIKDGNAIVDEITEKDIDKVFENATSDSGRSVTVDLSEAKADIERVTLTKKSVETIAEAAADDAVPVDELELKFTEASLTLDTKALKAVNEQAEGNNITLVVAKVKDTGLNGNQKKALKKEEVVSVIDAHIESNGVEIHDFSGGLVRVAIKFAVEPGKNESHYFALYVDKKGNKELYKTSYEEWLYCILYHTFL